jgi:hypothetical protein
MHRWNHKQRIFDSSGNLLPDDVADRLSTTLWGIIEEAFNVSEEERQKSNGTGIPAGKSLYDFVKEKANDHVPNKDERKILVQMSEMFGAYVGVPIWRQSLRFAWMEECCGGGRLRSSDPQTKNSGKPGVPSF